MKDATISVNRCIWGPDGSILGTAKSSTFLSPFWNCGVFLLLNFLPFLGVAFSKHIVQIYTYNPAGELRQHLEVKTLLHNHVVFYVCTIYLHLDVLNDSFHVVG